MTLDPSRNFPKQLLNEVGAEVEIYSDSRLLDQVSVQSQLGKGSTFTFKIPGSLAE